VVTANKKRNLGQPTSTEFEPCTSPACQHKETSEKRCDGDSRGIFKILHLEGLRKTEHSVSSGSQ
jgi:hypothetical protein